MNQKVHAVKGVCEEAETIARKLTGTYNWQGMLPELTGTSGLKRQMQRFIHLNQVLAGSHFTITERPWERRDGEPAESNYIIGWDQAALLADARKADLEAKGAENA